MAGWQQWNPLRPSLCLHLHQHPQQRLRLTPQLFLHRLRLHRRLRPLLLQRRRLLLLPLLLWRQRPRLLQLHH